MSAAVIPLFALSRLAPRTRAERRTTPAQGTDGDAMVAAGIAHDLNNVLGTVMTCSEMLVAETAVDSRQRRHAQMVMEAAKRAAELVEQLAAYARSDIMECAPTDACRAVRDALDYVRCTLPEKIALHAIIPSTPLMVKGDPRNLHRLVMNLCANAIHAMADGGLLSVTLSRSDVVAGHALSHGTLEPGRYVVLTVEDNGCGMDRTTLARIFDPSFTTRRAEGGTGLGLAVVKAIVERSGGAIGVRSSRSSGSTFTVHLRCVEAGCVAA